MFPVIIQAGIALFQWVLPRLFAVLGTVAVSKTVIQPIFDWLESQIMSKINGLPVDVVNFLHFSGVINAISIIFGAYAMAIGIRASKAAFAKKGAS